MPSVYELTRSFYQKQAVTIDAYDVTTSTNDLAKELPFHKGLHIVLAQTQTRGRGQFERQWLNAHDQNGQLLISYSSFYQQAPQPHLTTSIGIALHQSLKKVWPNQNFKIKEPNDLYIDDKKCGGLLLETVSQGEFHHLIIGLGLNVSSVPSQLDTCGSILNTIDDLMTETWFSFLSEWENLRDLSLKSNWMRMTNESKAYLSKYLV